LVGTARERQNEESRSKDRTNPEIVNKIMVGPLKDGGGRNNVPGKKNGKPGCLKQIAGGGPRELGPRERRGMRGKKLSRGVCLTASKLWKFYAGTGSARGYAQ